MIRRLACAGMVALAAAAPQHAWPQTGEQEGKAGARAPAVIRTADGRFSAWAADRSFADSAMRLAERITERLDAFLGGKAKGAVPVHIRFVEGLAAGEYRRGLVVQPESAVFTLTGPEPALVDAGLLAQALVEVLCYAHALAAGIPDDLAELPKLPYWAVAGLTAEALPGDADDLARLVKGMEGRQRSPTLAVVLGWKGPAPTRLERWHQSAFSRLLVDQLTRSRAEREAFAGWVRDFVVRPGTAHRFWADPKAGEVWWRQTVRLAAKAPLEPLLGRAETRAELARMLPTSVAGADGKPVLYTVDRLGEAPRNAALFVELRRKAAALRELAARGDVVARPVVLAYLDAVECLLNPKRADEYLARLEYANRLHRLSGEYMRVVGEFMDWFEVTRGPTDPEHRFNSYFALRRELEEGPSDMAAAEDVLRIDRGAGPGVKAKD